MKSKRYHIVSVFIGYYHLLHNLLYILVGSFHCAIHLRSVWRRVVMLDLELHVEFNDHGIVKVGAIVSDDPLRDTILADEVVLDKPGYDVLGN